MCGVYGVFLDFEFMPEKSLFIAVGAGHLPGDEGVIELLRKEGFRVTPVL